MDAVSVAVVSSRIEDEIIVVLLQSEGIKARSTADDAGGTNPELQLQGVHVLVDASEEAVARRVLESRR
jgi:hypothetical protein